MPLPPIAVRSECCVQTYTFNSISATRSGFVISYLPQMYKPQLSPRSCIMYAATRTFSVPWSPRTRLGSPCSATALRNTSKTVDALLFVLHLIPVMKRDLPSIKPWITNFHQISSEQSCQSRLSKEEKRLTVITVVMPQRIDVRYPIDTPLDWSVDKSWLQPSHSCQRSPDIVSGYSMTACPEGSPDKLNTILGKAVYDAFHKFI